MKWISYIHINMPSLLEQPPISTLHPTHLGHHNGLEWVNLTQMTIISTTVGKNPLEEME